MLDGFNILFFFNSRTLPYKPIFIATLALCLGLNSLGYIHSSAELNGVGMMLVILLGIPHGALDNEIAKRASGYSVLRFYLLYIGVMLGFLFMWLIWPMASLALFLLSSAYHFGQSQFSDLDKISHFSRALLYMTWGLLLLSCLILFRWAELEPLLQADADTQVLLPLLAPTALLTIACISSFLLILLIIFLTVRKEITLDRAAMETLLFGLISYAFYVFPLVLAFALYFCILHSLRVLHEEYHSLTKDGLCSSFTEFIRCLTPMTLISYAGLGLFFWAHEAEVLPISDLKMVFIITSLITLPHCFVMEFFYSLRSSKKLTTAHASLEMLKKGCRQ